MPARGRRTQIIATLGPATNSPETIASLVAAGMDVARLNFSHATHEEIIGFVARLRDVATPGAPRILILADLQGPKLRIGELPEPLQLRKGETVALTMLPDGGAGDVPAPEEAFSPAVAEGARMYLKDGSIELQVAARSRTRIEAVVQTGGELTSRAGLNIQGLAPGTPTLGPRDRADLAFAVAQGIDWLALSYVADPQVLTEARALLSDLGASTVRLVAKIELRAALGRLSEIAAAADLLMVARGDLGVEVGVEEVPIWQHRIIAAAARAGVPAIVATEMLESMRNQERPTRAEASDVAHSVWDGANALMLCAETAIGKFPVEAVATMDLIIRRAERETSGGTGPAFIGH